MSRPVDPTKLSKTERLNWMYGVDAMRMIEMDILGVVQLNGVLPPEWDEIWQEEDRRDPRRVRVTMEVDADVVKFFKAMGSGYQKRLNRVLRAFMHLRLAKIIEGPDATDFVLRPEEVMERARRQWKWGGDDGADGLGWGVAWCVASTHFTGCYLAVKNSSETAQAMEAHFERLQAYHRVMVEGSEG